MLSRLGSSIACSVDCWVETFCSGLRSIPIRGGSWNIETLLFRVIVDIELNMGEVDEVGELAVLCFDSQVSCLAKSCMSRSPDKWIGNRSGSSCSAPRR